jgi:DNA-binding NarL/FixJ family response regulator
MRQIRASHPEAKIIIVTNFDDPLLRMEARQAGATAYVIKEQMSELTRLLQGLSSS